MTWNDILRVQFRSNESRRAWLELAITPSATSQQVATLKAALAAFSRGCVSMVTREVLAADLDANDVGAVAILPAGCVPVGVVYDSDDLDTNASPTIVASVGFVNAGETDLDGTAWATGITTSQTGGALSLTLTPAVMRMAATQADRKVGIKFTAAAATKAAGQEGLTLLYRAV